MNNFLNETVKKRLQNFLLNNLESENFAPCRSSDFLEKFLCEALLIRAIMISPRSLKLLEDYFEVS